MGRDVLSNMLVGLGGGVIALFATLLTPLPWWLRAVVIILVAVLAYAAAYLLRPKATIDDRGADSPDASALSGLSTDGKLEVTRAKIKAPESSRVLSDDTAKQGISVSDVDVTLGQPDRNPRA